MARAKKDEDVYYVGISGPVALRKALLESSKTMIQVLKSYEMLRSVRTEKAELMIKYDNEMKALTRLVTKLKSGLPKTKFKETLSRVKAPEESPKKVLTKNQALDKIQGKPIKFDTKKKISELDKLEAELGDIESKMQTLR